MRFARGLRWLNHLRGGHRLLRRLSPLRPDVRFVLRSNGFRYLCEPGTYIDWAIATLGDYEPAEKRLFLDLIPAERRGTALDVGANVGAHALTFSRRFERVLAFEPNPQVFEKLKANLELNPQARIEPLQVGLSDEAAEIDFYQPSPEADNLGVGTFDAASRYEPCTVVKLPVCRGDTFLAQRAVGRIDAIKIASRGSKPGFSRALAPRLPGIVH